jgi:hypothetical protein
LQAHPEETCLSASRTLNLHRKRIARLLKVADALPPEFIEKAKETSDPKVLHQMSIKRLLRITAKNPERISKALKDLHPKHDSTG